MLVFVLTRFAVEYVSWFGWKEDESPSTTAEINTIDHAHQHALNNTCDIY